MQLIWCLLSNFISTCFGHDYAYHQENKSVHCHIWCSALVVMAVFTQLASQLPHNHSHHNQCKTQYAAVHTLVLLMMGIMVPETCWDKSLIINIRLVASCWFLSLRPISVKCCSHGTDSRHEANTPVNIEIAVLGDVTPCVWEALQPPSGTVCIITWHHIPEDWRNVEHCEQKTLKRTVTVWYRCTLLCQLWTRWSRTTAVRPWIFVDCTFKSI